MIIIYTKWHIAVMCMMRDMQNVIYMYTQHINETAIGDCELAKILDDSLTVIFIDIYILFFVSISAIFSHFLLFS